MTAVNALDELISERGPGSFEPGRLQQASPAPRLELKLPRHPDRVVRQGADVAQSFEVGRGCSPGVGGFSPHPRAAKGSHVMGRSTRGCNECASLSFLGAATCQVYQEASRTTADPRQLRAYMFAAFHMGFPRTF